MTRARTSLVRLPAAALVVVAVLTYVAPLRAAKPEKLLAPDTEAVLCFNFKDAGSSADQHKALDQAKNLLPGDKRLEILMNQALQVVKEVHTATVGLKKIKIDVPAPGQKPDFDAEWLAVVRGKFDIEQAEKNIAEALKSRPDALSSSEHAGVKVYELKADGKNFVAAFLGSDTAVASDKKEAVTAAIDRSQSKGESKLNKEMATLVEKVDPKYTVWFAMSPAGLKAAAAGAGVGAAGGAAGDKFEGVVFGMAMGKETSTLNLVFHAGEAAAAAQTKMEFENLKQLAAGFGLDKDTLDLIQKVDVSTSDTAVNVKLVVDEETKKQLEKLMKKLQVLKPGG